MNFRFDHPEYLWLLLLAVPIVLLGWYSLAALEPVRRWTAVGLRLAVLLILVAMLAGLQAVRWHEDLTVVAVVDQSESVRRFAQPPRAPDDAGNEPVTAEQWVRRWLGESAQGKRPDDRLGVVTYDGRPTVRAMPSPAIDTDPGTLDSPIEGTDSASAIRLGMALFPEGSGKRLVLVSDGNDTVDGDAENTGATSGGLLAAVREAKAAGIAIDVLPIEYQVRREVMIEGVYAPTEAREGQTVALRVVLRATEPTDGMIYLKHDGEPVDLSPVPGSDTSGAPVGASEWTVEEDARTRGRGDAETSTPAPNDPSVPASPRPGVPASSSGRYVCVKLVNLPMAFGGVNKFEAVFEPLDAASTGGGGRSDAISANNRAESFTLVHGKGRVLFVNNVPLPSGDILPDVLREHGIELDVVTGTGVPNKMAALQRYDAVILQNVPAELVPPPTQRLLARYVNDLGGGLIMVGGPDSFAAGGWTNSPIDDILPVECEIPSQTILPAGALVIVIDRSGSMSSPVGGQSVSQQEVANEAAALAVSTLYPQDMVGVVAFDDSAKWIVPLSVNDDPKAVSQRIHSIQPGGGTNIYPGLEAAYESLAKLDPADAGIRHIILLTDGQSNEGDYIGLIGEMARRGITLSTVGVGDGHNVQLLRMLAEMSGGHYYGVTDPYNLPQVFVKEARTIRKNLIKEKPFTPQLVQTGSSITSDIAGLPELKGFVLTGEKYDPRVFMPIVGPEGEPVFAHWQVGLGRSAAFTSDATNRWAVDWLPWGGYADFWSRTVRAIARPSALRQFDLLTTVRNDNLIIRLDAPNSDEPGRGKPSGGAASGGGFANFLNVKGSVLRPDGSTAEVTLRQTGPGLYEAQLPAREAGNYVVSLFVQDDAPGGERQAVFGGASRATGAELRRFRSDIGLLRQVAELTGGRMLDPADATTAAIFDREAIVPTRSVRPLWRDLMPWLLALFLLDVAARRIAWDAGAMWRWLREKATALFATRQIDAGATLGALKARAARTAEKLGKGTEQAPPTAVPAVPVAVRTTKFEADPDAQAGDDFAAAVGGARASSGESPLTAAREKAAADQPQTTSRLLDAKRRARGES